jgi:hypothetical protein
MTPKDHVIDRAQPIEIQLKQAEEWIDQLIHSSLELQKSFAAKEKRIEKLEQAAKKNEIH